MLQQKNCIEMLIKKGSLLMVLSMFLILFYKNFSINIFLAEKPVAIYLNDITILISSLIISYMLISIYENLKTAIIIKYGEKSFLIAILLRRLIHILIIFLLYISFKGLSTRILYRFNILDINIYDLGYQILLIFFVYFTLRDFTYSG